MAHFEGAMCTQLPGICRDNYLAWCDKDEEGNCTGGTMGDLNMSQLMLLPFDEFRKAIAASTTKFKLDRECKFVEVGLFENAGAQKGDRLTGIFPVGGDSVLQMNDKFDRERILTWFFEEPLLNILYERDGVSHSHRLKNPAVKE